ncbi:DNA (cytosine-5-)-methyltransferase [Arcobacter sp. CECT 8983]|uniref:DNA cytosine methyltransferase n=1 Tax=Arcobacter sp. CECT 8983 TaxID=2044508 RepID=UPI00100BC2D3|nr:DNA cytosine methyltransferase [Arcobacter sp. CECT 8983]RXJ91682.1 DNA (cytosine-5-)-methyltransferase [Arcobacter sp. CECT 8983]
MNKIDLFCGCGGLSLGFKQAGFNNLFSIDFWPDAIETYNHNMPNSNAYCECLDEDIVEKLDKYYNGEEIHTIIGGPPCQGFSTVGTNRLGKRDVEDPRNYLYQHFLKFVKHHRPYCVLIENVKGMKTLDKGRYLNHIISEIKEMGYNVKYEILNASEYGVPQSRYRLFIVGYLMDNFEFPKPVDYKVTTSEAISDLPSLDVYSDLKDCPTSFVYSKKLTDYQVLLKGKSKLIFNHEPTNHTEQTKDIISKIKDGGRITDLPEEYWNIRKYNKSFQRMNSCEPSHTIDTGHRNYFHYKENRVPSVRECARIQSFPDNFIFLKSKTSQYKQVGNAVPPILANKLAIQIKKYIELEDIEKLREKRKKLIKG